MNKYEHDYRVLLENIIDGGRVKDTRTGSTMYLHNKLLLVDADPSNFPLITGRKMFWKNVWAEAEWMMSGSTNVSFLHKYGVHIWDQWADKNGELGPTYGAQLMKQWPRLLHDLRHNKNSRRHVVDLWAHDLLTEMALPPCYFSLVFYYTGNDLNLSVTFRSSDAAVGLPYDVAVLSYILNKVAMLVEASVGKLACFLIDVHINSENLVAIDKYLSTEYYELPSIDFSGDRFYLSGYTPNEHIQMTIKA